MITRKAFVQMAEMILEGGAKKVTKIFGPKEVMKATRRGPRRRGERTTEILFTIGGPNYAERLLIKRAQKAGEKFPIKGYVAKYAK